jgi:hypothetical protein
MCFLKQMMLTLPGPSMKKFVVFALTGVFLLCPQKAFAGASFTAKVVSIEIRTDNYVKVTMSSKTGSPGGCPNPTYSFVLQSADNWVFQWVPALKDALLNNRSVTILGNGVCNPDSAYGDTNETTATVTVF